MKIHTELVQKICIVTCDGGRFDASFAPSFLGSMQYLIRKGHLHLILDLSSVVFLDSTGLGAVVRCLKDVGDRGLVVLCGVNPKVLSLLKMTHLEEIFTMAEDRDQALVVARADLARRNGTLSSPETKPEAPSSEPSNASVFDESLLSSLKMEEDDAVLEIDSSERRRYRRIPQQQIVNDEMVFICTNRTTGRRVSGVILDISPSGILFASPVKLSEEDGFLVEGNIGRTFKLRENVVIRNRKDLNYGFEFVKPSDETTSFLHQLTGAVMLTSKTKG